MTARLSTNILVGALIRKVEASGGFAAVLHKGDPTSGSILLQLLERGQEKGLFERIPDYAGGYSIVPCGPDQSAESSRTADYIARRRRSDPDLWLIELDIPEGERLAVETLC